jgi:hypothetical protein
LPVRQPLAAQAAVWDNLATEDTMDRNQNESNPGLVEQRLDETPVEREGMQGAGLEREGLQGGSTERESMHGAGREVERENLQGEGLEREGMQGGEVERDDLSGAEGGDRLDDQENRTGGYGYDRPADLERSSDGMLGAEREGLDREEGMQGRESERNGNGSSGTDQGPGTGRDW